MICGYTRGEGKRERYFGALLCGVYDKGKLRYVGKVGTGWNEDDLEKITQNLKKIETDRNPFDIFGEEPEILEKIVWVKPRLISEVKFMNLSEKLIMRAPSFVRLRKDKLPEECILA